MKVHLKAAATQLTVPTPASQVQEGKGEGSDSWFPRATPGNIAEGTQRGLSTGTNMGRGLQLCYEPSPGECPGASGLRKVDRL